MPVIDRHAQIINDIWRYHDPAKPARDQQANIVLDLDELKTLGAQPPVLRPLGVIAPAGTSADQLMPYLDSLDLVVVEFPKFRDGRGFTLARTLRNKLGFTGDIRASGHILPDQLAALVQCGVSSIDLPSDHPVEQWVQSLPGASPAIHKRPLLQRLLSEKAAAVQKPDVPL